MAEINSYRQDILNVFEQELPWNKLTGANILITGATGLIGGCLVEVLMMNPHRDYHVFASGRNEERARRFNEFVDDDSFHFLKYDVLLPLEDDIHFDYIIHAASNASPYFFVHNPVEIMKSNIIGVVNLMEYGIKHGMKRLLFVSTGEIYGEGDGRIFTEDYSGYVDCIKTRSCYPSSKRAAETLCVSYAEEYGADVVIARLCHTYGPYFTEQDNRVFAQFIRNVLRDEDIVLKSAGDQFRSWCYVVDAVSALLYILLKGGNCEAYNVADINSNISIRKLAEVVSEIAGRRVIFDIPDIKEQKGYNVVKKSVFSTNKLESLGWCAKTSISEGIKHTIQALKMLP